jgi:hypothetical protein
MGSRADPARAGPQRRRELGRAGRALAWPRCPASPTTWPATGTSPSAPPATCLSFNWSRRSPRADGSPAGSSWLCRPAIFPSSARPLRAYGWNGRMVRLLGRGSRPWRPPAGAREPGTPAAALVPRADTAAAAALIGVAGAAPAGARPVCALPE